MADKPRLLILFITALFLTAPVALVGNLAIAAEDDPEVKAQSDTVDKDGDIDNDDEQAKLPADVTVVGPADAQLEIRSLEFEPESPWKFRKFTDEEKQGGDVLGIIGNAKEYVDIEDRAMIVDNADGPVAKFAGSNTGLWGEAVFPDSEVDAGDYPLRMEGNLTKGGSGEGPPPEKHWAAKTKYQEVDLSIQDLPEETEETPHEEDPGGLVILNKDDEQTEDDLVPVQLGISSSLAASSNAQVTLEVTSGTDHVELWKTAEKKTSFGNEKTWTAGNQPDIAYVEGTKISDGSLPDVELTLAVDEDGDGTPDISDAIKATVFDVKLIAVGDGARSNFQEELRQVYDDGDRSDPPGATDGPELILHIKSHVMPVLPFLQTINEVYPKVRLEMSEIDTSHGDPDYDRYTGGQDNFERVEFKWSNAEPNDQRIGVPESYDAGTGEFFLYATNLGLPLNNSNFGAKTVKLKYDGERRGDPLDWQAFFPRLAKNHPGSTSSANWHYYWSQEGSPVVCQYSRDDTDPDYAEWDTASSDHPNAYGGYNNGVVFIYNNALSKAPWNYDFPEGQGNHPNWVSFEIDVDTDPDFVNITYAHEKTHKMMDDAVSNQGMDDQDMDGVPDNWEMQVPGMNPGNPDSFGTDFNEISQGGADRDNEFYSVLGGAFSAFGNVMGMAEVAYEGSVPDDATEQNDWSKNGANW